MLTNLSGDLAYTIQNVYKQAGMRVTNVAVEAESAEYGAFRLELDDRLVVFRVAKTTPTKIGQFVTIWKRPTPSAEIAPLDSKDGVTFVVVHVSDDTHNGQFVFDQDLLIKKGVMSLDGIGGKRAIRVYPPWSKPVAKDAIKTQQWQIQRFFPIAKDGSADSALVRKLFKCTLESTLSAQSPEV